MPCCWAFGSDPQGGRGCGLFLAAGPLVVAVTLKEVGMMLEAPGAAVAGCVCSQGGGGIRQCSISGLSVVATPGITEMAGGAWSWDPQW